MGEAEINAFVYFVGVGPGDPLLITLKAISAISHSDVILHDNLIHEDILAHRTKESICLPVGKQKGGHSIAQKDINGLLIQYAEEGKIIARLKSGDPGIFGRLGEEQRALEERGITYEIIPGITAACAAGADFRFSLTHRDFASRLVFHTGHRKRDSFCPQLKFDDTESTTHVIYMGLSVLEDLINQLRSQIKTPKIPICIVEKATFPDSKAIWGDTEDILEKLKKEILSSPVLIFIGGSLRAKGHVGK